MQQSYEQLNDLRQKDLQKLTQEQTSSEKRLGSLKKIYLAIKDQFNKQINLIIEIIEFGMEERIQGIKEQIETIEKSISDNTLTQVEQVSKDFQKETQMITDDIYLQQDEKIRIQTIEQYQQLLKSFDQLTSLQQIWKEEVPSAQQIVSSDAIQQQETDQVVNKLGQYQWSSEMSKVSSCWAMDMDKDEQILVNGQSEIIQLWNYNVDGSFNLFQTLTGHTACVRSLCLSKKDNNWFISGSEDKTLIIWEKQQDGQWTQNQILKAHENKVWNVVLNSNEDQFISCSSDQTIKFWMKKVGSNIWECKQTLTEHFKEVFYLGLNENCDLLASSGCDNLRIWAKGLYSLWNKKQVLDHPVNDYYNRICFNKSSELIATTDKGKFLKLTPNKKGLLTVSQEILVTDKTEPWNCFPIVYCSQLEIAVYRHDKCVYLLTAKAKGEYSIHQILKGNYIAGYLSQNGRHLKLSNYATDKIETWELK